MNLIQYNKLFICIGDTDGLPGALTPGVGATNAILG